MTTGSARDRVTKGERTRRRIVERAAALFNTRGVAGASMSDVSDAAGLEKGGVYNHFESKDALALAAFEYASSLVLDRVERAMAANAPGLPQFFALIDSYRSVVEKPPLAGGCPLLNTAVEADDTNPAMRARARAAIARWRGHIVSALESAVSQGEIAPVDVESLATLTIAAIEGGVMLAKLYRDPTHIERVAVELRSLIASMRSASAREAPLHG